MTAAVPLGAAGRRSRVERHPLIWTFLAISPLGLLIIGLLFKSVGGPAWLAYNSDPEYEYLVNSLLVLRRLPPFIVEHPGIPLVMMGAVVTSVIHAVTGQGSLETDLVARPEAFISAIHATALAVTALLVLITGVILARRTSLRDALFVQAAPWISAPLIFELSRLRPEVALVGGTVAFAGVMVLYMESPARPARFAVHAGIVVGVCVALRYTAVLLGIGPLLVLSDWRDRRTFAGTAAAAFLAGIIVSIRKIPAMGRWTIGLALHAGSYGGGDATVINPARFLPSLGALLRGEPVTTLILAAGLATWIIWRREASGANGLTPRRVLGAMCAMQIAQFLVVAKQPNAHYVVPMIATAGVSMCAMSRFWATRFPRAFQTASVILAVVILGYQVSTQVAHAETLRSLREQGEKIRAITEATAEADHCTTIYWYRASSPAYALQFGNLWSGLRIADSLQARYPDVLFDEGDLHIRTFDWKTVDLASLLRSRSCVLMEAR